jgi:hypothetical protein
MRLQIKDIKKGDIFWEKSRAFRALEDRRTLKGNMKIFGKLCDQYEVKAECLTDGSDVNFLVTDGAEHYGPTLYTERQYYPYGTNPIV